MPDGGRLSWNSVAAPDFGNSIQAYKAFSDMLGQMAQSGQDVVKGVQTAQSTNADRALQLNLMKYTNPADLQAAEANGTATAGVNTNYLTPDQIAAIPGRVTTLLNQQTTGLTNENQASENALTNITRPIAGRDAQNTEAARPFQFDLHQIAMDPQYQGSAQAVANGNAAIQKYYADNPNAKAAIAKLPYSDQYSTIQDIQNITRNALTNQGTAQSNTQTGLSIQDTMDNRNGEAIAGIVRPLGGGIREWGPLLDDPKALGSALEAAGYKGPVTQNAIERARRVLVGDNSMRADSVASDGGGGGGGSGSIPGAANIPGGDPSRVLNNVARGAGLGPSLPPEVKTMGDFSNWAEQTNAKHINSTAAGLYQIEGSTLRKAAPLALGPDWQSKPFDAQNQDKVAQYIYDNNKGSVAALQKQWPSLSDAKAASLVNGNWAQARGVIAPGESGASEAMIEGMLRNQAGVVNVNSQITQNSANQPRQAAAQELLTRADDNSSANDLAVQLTAKGQPYEGNTVESVTRQIANFQHKYGGTAAQAAWAMGQAKMGNVGGLHRFARTVDYALNLTKNGTNVQTDNDKLDYYGQMIKDPKGMAAAAIAKTTGDTTKAIVSNTNAQVMALSQQKYAARMAAQGAGRPWTDANEQYWNSRIAAAASMAGGAMNVGHKVVAYGTAPDGGANNNTGQTPPPSSGQGRSTLTPVPANVPAQALNARSFLQRKVAEALDGVGPAQIPLIKQQLARQWHLKSLDSINNPQIAWTVAKALDAAVKAQQPAFVNYGAHGAQ